MSLPHMAWRYVGTRTFGTASMASLMDELFTLGTATTYADSTSRTPGSGSAGTWARVQISSVTECLHVAPPVNALNTRIMIGGATYTPSPSPTMHSPESYAASNLMVNLVKNAGTFTTWNATNPFTSGQTFGWGKWWSTANGVGNVYLWEGREAIAVIVTNSAGGSAFGFMAGAIIDPESNDTTTDGESDGRVYGIVRSGVSTAITGTFWTDWNSQFGGNTFLRSSNANSQFYNGVFSPGSASLIQCNPMMTFSSSPSPTGLKTRSGMFGRLAITMRGSTPDNLIGRLREVYGYSDAQLPARQTDGANVIGYAFCGSSVAQVDSLLLEHA
jgi:hypothetical protein